MVFYPSTAADTEGKEESERGKRDDDGEGEAEAEEEG